MRQWLRRIRGAVIVGLTWAVGWGLVGFLVMETFVDPHGSIADIWPMVLGIPGFFGGVIFSVMLGMAEGRRRFDELSLARFGVWGAVTGALLGVLGGAAIGLSGVIIVPLTLLGAASATGSLALARMGGEPRRLDGGADGSRARLDDGE
jgi:O-antigen/teichoic acid export membrane protein